MGTAVDVPPGVVGVAVRVLRGDHAPALIPEVVRGGADPTGWRPSPVGRFWRGGRFTAQTAVHAAVVGVSVKIGIVSQQAAVAAGNSVKGPPALPGLLFPAIEAPSGRSVAVSRTLPWPSTGWATATSMLRMKQEARVAEGEKSL